jgi:hypothetical protein
VIEDELLSHDGMGSIVAEVVDTEEYEAVSNLRVAECYPWFVGRARWAKPLGAS